MWVKTKSWCWHSLTVAWGYIQIAAGMLAVFTNQLLDSAMDLLGDPALSDSVRAFMPSKGWATFIAVCGAITVAARIRSLVRKA
jgi:hypothetical protein